MATTATTINEVKPKAQQSQISVTWRRFRKHKLGLIGLNAIVLMLLACIFVPIIVGMFTHITYETIDDQALTPVIVNGDITFTKPMMFTTALGTHILGTNEIGRDVFVRLFFAGRISLAVGIFTTIIVILVGGLVGALAGYYGGAIDTLLMRFVDLMLAIPSLPILLISARLLQQSQIMEKTFGTTLGSAITIITVLSIFGWMGISRLVRGSILSLRSLDFVEASRALGASNRAIIMKHLIPNSIAPIIVAATLGVGDFIISESALSFLGLGIRDPTPSWGNMLEGARDFMRFITNVNPLEEIRGYLVLFPGLMILITVLSINFMGDALRDALDPRMKT